MKHYDGFTRITIDGIESIGGYPSLSGAIEALDPFQRFGK